jgi:sigma-B regulation protein RsbU (phosphoserine phosphatase)
MQLNLFIIFFVAVFAGIVVRRYQEGRNYVSLRSTFRTRLLVSVILVYIIVQAGIFSITTATSKSAASKQMDGEIEFIINQIIENRRNDVAAVDSSKTATPSKATSQTPLESDSSQRLVEGYDISEGIIVVFANDTVMYTDYPAYAVGATIEETLGKVTASGVRTCAQTGGMRTTIFGAQSVADVLDLNSDNLDQVHTAELGFMRAQDSDGFTVVMIMPASTVFANRSATVVWGSLLALTISVAVYISAARLLNKVVVKPIDHTNESLAKITQGDLDELVTESDSVEFASLSAGINTTVDALKGLINESERRMERDLATAKAIQESALPRTFPPFPEIKAFDIFATMEAAKEVGGDFYDFFLIDDHTLCFLIADVSGKGIPGALFMMAAKTEIENYLSTGMDPSEAIASANKRLCANNDAGMFVTVWAATLDYDTGLLTYVNAGHNFPLLRHGKNGSWEWLKKKCGLFLGTFETAKYRQETIMLEPDDELLLYTDGVNEAFSVNDEEFGNDRLETWLANHQDLAPEDLVHGLRAEVAQWAKGAEQSDDITILALEYGAVPEASGSITVTATLDHLYDVIDLVETEMNQRLCPVGIQHKVEIALEELFVNVCRYAYADKDEPGDVTVSYVYSGENKSITVELRDSGIPFNPVTLEDPTKPSDIQEAKIGGLGIFMVKKSMDDLVYEHDGDYNVVTFTKGW